MNIIVTGASKGIGKEIARALAGKKINNLYLIARSKKALVDIQEECLSINSGLNIVLIASDLNDLLKDNDFVSKLILVDKIDVLINNAGYLINKSFVDITDKEILEMFNLNTFLPAKLIRMLLPKLKTKDASHVVNIGSMGGYQGSSKFPGLSFYSASKAALSCLTECLSTELSEYGIRFNCLALGAVQTEMLRSAFPDYSAPVTPQQMGEYIAEFALSGHMLFNGKVIPVSVSTP